MFSVLIEEERRIQRKKAKKFADDLERLDAFKAQLERDGIPEWARPDMIDDWLAYNNIDL